MTGACGVCGQLLYGLAPPGDKQAEREFQMVARVALAHLAAAHAELSSALAGSVSLVVDFLASLVLLPVSPTTEPGSLRAEREAMRLRVLDLFGTADLDAAESQGCSPGAVVLASP